MDFLHVKLVPSRQFASNEIESFFNDIEFIGQVDQDQLFLSLVPFWFQYKQIDS